MITLQPVGSGAQPVPQRLELSPEPAAPAQARRFVADQLVAAPTETADDALLLVSELVTNAVRHGTGTVVVTVAVDATLIQVDVHDDGAGRPPLEATRPGDDAVSGRGLLIVEAMSSDWGVAPDTEGAGKTVWFELLV